MNLQLLLQSVQDIKDKYDAIYKNNGTYFNIFDITNISTDEVRICRIIKELIDPNGSHYQGDIYLKLFVKYVLNMENEFSAADYSSAIVHRELAIKNNRRIDLFIEIGTKKIPIEVKVYADDQPAQCEDYYAYAQNSNIFYLTLDGHEPSEYSIGKLKKKYIHLISFKKEIILWLQACLQNPNTSRIESIKVIISQLIDVLQTLTNQGKDEMELDIKNLLLTSSQNLRNADLIVNAAKLAEQELKYKVLFALKKELKQSYNWECIDNNLSYGENSKASNPGISYYLCPIPNTGLELFFRIEIDYRDLFAGFYIAENKKCSSAAMKYSKQFNSPITSVPMRSSMPSNTQAWVCWKHLAKQKLDFQTHNDTYYSLLDDQAFDVFIQMVMDDIDNIMVGLLPPYKKSY